MTEFTLGGALSGSRHLFLSLSFLQASELSVPLEHCSSISWHLSVADCDCACAASTRRSMNNIWKSNDFTCIARLLIRYPPDSRHLVAWIRQESSKIRHLWRLTDA